MQKMSIPSIHVDLDDALNRRCSVLFPENKLTISAEESRKKRKSSFATFQIVDEHNCGMWFCNNLSV